MSLLWVAISGFVSGVLFAAVVREVYTRHVIKKHRDDTLDSQLAAVLGPDSETQGPDPLKERIQLRLMDEWRRRG